MTTPNTLLGNLVFRTSLEPEVAQAYEDRALKNGVAAELAMASTLKQFAHVDSSKPIVLSDAQRREIEAALGRNFNTSEELTTHVVRSLQLRVGEIEVPLSPHLLDRLKTRCIGMEFSQFVIQTVKRGLEEFAGLR